MVTVVGCRVDLLPDSPTLYFEWGKRNDRWPGFTVGTMADFSGSAAGLRRGIHSGCQIYPAVFGFAQLAVYRRSFADSGRTDIYRLFLAELPIPADK